MLALGGAMAHADYPLDGLSLAEHLRGGEEFARPLYFRMNHRNQRAHRLGDWKYLRVDQHEYLFNILADERERANFAMRELVCLDAMCVVWEVWNASIPGIPEDATVSLGFGLKDMPQR